MKAPRRSPQRLAPLALAVIGVMAASMTLALIAPAARASDGGMSGTEGMSAEEMQNMATPPERPWTRIWTWAAARPTGSW